MIIITTHVTPLELPGLSVVMHTLYLLLIVSINIIINYDQTIYFYVNKTMFIMTCNINAIQHDPQNSIYIYQFILMYKVLFYNSSGIQQVLVNVYSIAVY